jgi:hypothetical protein
MIGENDDDDVGGGGDGDDAIHSAEWMHFTGFTWLSCW